MPSSICFFFALSRNIDQWFLGMLERDVGEKDRGAGSKQIGYPRTPAALELVRGLHPITQYQWILTGTRAAGVPSQFSPVEQIALSGVEFLDPRLCNLFSMFAGLSKLAAVGQMKRNAALGPA